jgi:putative transcriptional regulator
MIRWRLRVVMAERCMSNDELAEKMQLHPVTVSKPKNAKDLPAIGGKKLNKLCKVLECTPADLIQYVPDEEGKPD